MNLSNNKKDIWIAKVQSILETLKKDSEKGQRGALLSGILELSPFASSSSDCCRRRRGGGRGTEEQPYFRKWPVLITLVITIMSRLELSLQHSSRQALEWEKEAKSEYTFFPLLSPSSGLHRSLLATFTNAAAMAMAHLLALPILVFDKK